MAGPPAVVASPPVAPPRISLVNAAFPNPPGESDDWFKGFRFEPEACSGTGIVDPCEVSSRPIGDQVAARAYQPFAVWAGDKCSTQGARVRDWQGRARRLLEACESAQIAREFWTGTQATESSWDENLSLAHPDSDVLSSGPLDIVEGFACLEEGLAQNCGARGMIHISRSVAIWADHERIVRREGNLLLTANDTIVVADAGYPGTGPNGEAPLDGSVWAYATSMVTVRRGPIWFVPEGPGIEALMREALDRNVNTVEVRAERFAAATWDGCAHFAVELDIPSCNIGGPGS